MLANATDDFEQLRRTLLKPMRRSMKLFPQELIQRTVEQRESSFLLLQVMKTETLVERA